MNHEVFHGILVSTSFKLPSFVKNFNIFDSRKSTSNPWILFGIEVLRSALNSTIIDIQNNLKENQPYYAHLYDDEDLIVIFKNKVLKATPHSSTWKEIIEYGIRLGIPRDQLDFWPNRFQDEKHYFADKNAA